MKTFIVASDNFRRLRHRFECLAHLVCKIPGIRVDRLKMRITQGDLQVQFTHVAGAGDRYKLRGFDLIGESWV